MDVLRPPDERFAGLTGFDHERGHVDVGDGLRMAYVAAGPVDGPVVVLSHGSPAANGQAVGRSAGPGPAAAR